MKRKYFVTMMILIVVIFASLVTGCSDKNKTKDSTSKISKDSSSKSSKETVEFKSKDGNESIKASPSWKNQADIGDSLIMHIYDQANDTSVMVVKESKSTFSDNMKLNDYTDLIQKTMANSMTLASLTKVKELNIDGNKAEYFELSGESKKVKLTFMVICMETSDNFYKISGWTSSIKFKKYKDEIQDIMKSLKVTQNTVNDKSKSNSEAETVDFKSQDGKVSVQALPSWKSQTDLSDTLIIHIADLAKDNSVMVVKEPKSTFSDNIKLSDYTKLIKTNMVNNITLANLTKIKDIDVNGYKAKYFEISGETKQVKLSFMVICIETSDNFYKISGWTTTPNFKANKDEIQEVMNSIKVTE